jgi:RNA polymerase sigma factor (sigma-70 family)
MFVVGSGIRERVPRYVLCPIVRGAGVRPAAVRVRWAIRVHCFVSAKVSNCMPLTYEDHTAAAVLVLNCCADDPTAVTTLYCNLLVPTAKSVVRAFRANNPEPEELANILFIRLSENNWRRLKSWKENLPGWLRRVCSHLFLEIVQGLSRNTPLTDLQASRLADDESVLDQLVRDQTGFQLNEAIEQLDLPRDRRVVRLHYIFGESLLSIAEELDVPVATLYVIKKRALARLRRLLEEKVINADASRA